VVAVPAIALDFKPKVLDGAIDFCFCHGVVFGWVGFGVGLGGATSEFFPCFADGAGDPPLGGWQ
jgi:hypothetical protein